MEQITIIGNVGKSEVREQNGTKQLMFSVAVDNSYKDQNGNKIERTNWYTVWSSEVKRIEWIKKGASVLVQGRFSASIYKSNDGRTGMNYSINSPYIEITKFAPKDETETASTATPTVPTPTPEGDDLPF